MTNIIISVPVKVHGDSFKVQLSETSGKLEIYDAYDGGVLNYRRSARSISEGLAAIERIAGRAISEECKSIIIGGYDNDKRR